MTPTGGDATVREATAATTRRAVLAYLDALNAGDVDRIAACVTTDFVNEHTAAIASGLHGREAYRRRLPDFLATFAGLHYECEDLVVEGDRAALAYVMTAEWLGDPPRRHPVRIRGMFRLRVDGDAVAHRCDYWDSADFQRQVGVDR